jgi:hypothetical protein
MHAEQLSLLGDAPTRVRVGRHPSTGQQRKATGQFKAANSSSTWLSGALERLPKFLRTLVHDCGEPVFRMEQFRGFLHAEKVPEPKHANAWGALPQAAVRAGLIRFTGRYAEAMNPSAHARIVKLWEVAK